MKVQDSAQIDSNAAAARSVTHYFAQLALHGQTRGVLAQWNGLSAAAYFAAMSLPASTVNAEHRSCSLGPVTLGELFRQLAGK